MKKAAKTAKKKPTKKAAKKAKPKKDDLAPIEILPPLGDCWARVLYYTPFTMGGEVWQHHKYKVPGYAITLPGEIDGFIAKMPDGSWNCYDILTGGCLGDGENQMAAIIKAHENINATPNLKQQIKEMHEKRPLSSLPETTAEEAARRLAKAGK